MELVSLGHHIPFPTMSMIAGIRLKLSNCNYNCRKKSYGNFKWKMELFLSHPITSMCSIPTCGYRWDLLRFSFLHNATEPSEDLQKGEIPLAVPTELTDLGTKDLPTAIGSGFLIPMDPLETPQTNDSRISSRIFLTASTWDKWDRPLKLIH